MSDLEKNKQVFRDFVHRLHSGDAKGAFDLYDDNVRIEVKGSTLSSGVLTKERAVLAVDAVEQKFPGGLEMTIHRLTAEEDRVLAETESHGRHISGAIYNNHYIIMTRIHDGKIVEWVEYLDTEHVTDVVYGGKRPQPA